jgi:hypothetical protein
MIFKISSLRVPSSLKFQGLWKVLVILLALVNLKSLPFAWHVSLSIAFFPDV